MSDRDLELALAGCAGALAYPPTPDLVAAVGRRLEGGGRPRRTRRRLLVLAFALLLATAGIAAGVTAGLHGLGVVFVDRVPSVPPGSGLSLGLRVSPDEARRLAGFPVITPAKPLGAPAAWFAESVEESRVLTLVWGHRDDLPPVRHGVSVLATETPGTVDPAFATKFVGPDATVRAIRVNGAPGIWITGAPHAIAWSTAGGYPHQTIRLVGNVIVWNQGVLLVRIEGARTLAEALRLARSFASS